MAKGKYHRAVSEALAKEAARSKAAAKTAPKDQKEAAGRRARITDRLRDLWEEQHGD